MAIGTKPRHACGWNCSDLPPRSAVDRQPVGAAFAGIAALKREDSVATHNRMGQKRGDGSRDQNSSSSVPSVADRGEAGRQPGSAPRPQHTAPPSAFIRVHPWFHSSVPTCLLTTFHPPFLRSGPFRIGRAGLSTAPRFRSVS